MNKAINFFHDLSFKKKLMLSYIVLLLIPTVLGGVYFYSSAVLSLRQKTESMIDQRLNQEKSNIDKKLEEFEKVAQNISQNSLINDFFNDFYTEDSEFVLFVKNNVQPLVSWWLTTNPGISELRYYTYNQNISSFYLFSPAQKYDKEVWFGKMRQGTQNLTPYWEDYHRIHQNYTQKSTQKVYSLFYPIVLPNAAGNAYLEIEITPAYLFRQLNETPIGHSGFTFIVNSNKEIIQSNHPDLSAGIVQNMDSSVFEGSNDSGHSTVKIENTRYSVSYLKINKLNCYIVGVIPSEEITQNLSNARNMFIFILVLSIGVLTAIAYLLSGILVKKVKSLVNAVHRIQNQDFSIHIPVNGRDEIDELAENINVMSAKINDLINKVYKSEIAQKEAELVALQMQINPHFLFNTLEVLKMMAEIEEQHKISDAIASLGNLMRYNLTKSEDMVYLKDEIENTRDYVNIQKLLLNDRLKVTYSIEAAHMLYRVPNLIIQPIIENSIFHGYINRTDDLLIKINTVTKDEDIIIMVSDNGSGISENRIMQIRKCLNNPDQKRILHGRGHGLALTNINNRIKLKYGDKYGIDIESQPGYGTTVFLSFPYTEQI
jgi:two-component system, sensor histidine kinase YesM